MRLKCKECNGTWDPDDEGERCPACRDHPVETHTEKCLKYLVAIAKELNINMNPKKAVQLTNTVFTYTLSRSIPDLGFDEIGKHSEEFRKTFESMGWDVQKGGTKEEQ